MEIFICFEDNGREKDFIFFIQLIVIIGKYHIHEHKWFKLQTKLSPVLARTEPVWHHYERTHK